MPGHCPNVGIQVEKNRNPYLIVYPNPASKFINVYVNQPIKNIQLFNLQGQNIYSENVEGLNLAIIESQLYKGVIY